MMAPSLSIAVLLLPGFFEAVGSDEGAEVGVSEGAAEGLCVGGDVGAYE